MTIPRPLPMAAPLALVVSLLAGSALAANKPLAIHGDWEAYSFTEKAGRVCYAASLPKRSEGGAKDRETFVTVTHRPADKALDVFGVSAGYAFKKGSEAEVEIDGQKFKLFTSGDGAWARDGDTDRQLVEAMIKGSRMIVRGTPAKGRPTVDTYSLSGFTAAYREIGKACGVKR